MQIINLKSANRIIRTMWFSQLDRFREHKLYDYARQALETFRRPDRFPIDYVAERDPKPKKITRVAFALLPDGTCDTTIHDNFIRYRSRSRRIVRLVIEHADCSLKLCFTRSGMLIKVRCFYGGQPIGEQITVRNSGSIIDYAQYSADSKKHGVHCRTVDCQPPDMWIKSKCSSTALTADISTMYCENGRILRIQKYDNGKLTLRRDGEITYVSSEYDDRGRLIYNIDRPLGKIQVHKYTDGYQDRTFEAPQSANGWTAKLSVLYRNSATDVYTLVYINGRPDHIIDDIRAERIPVDAEGRRHGRAIPQISSYHNWTIQEWSHGGIVAELNYHGDTLASRVDWLDYDIVRVTTYGTGSFDHIGHYLGDRKTKHGSHITNPNCESSLPSVEEIWDHGRHLYTRWLDIDGNITAIAPPGGNPIGTVHVYMDGELTRSDTYQNDTHSVIKYTNGAISSKLIKEGKSETHYAYTAHTVTREKYVNGQITEHTTLTRAGKVINSVRNIVKSPTGYKGHVDALSRWMWIQEDRGVAVTYTSGYKTIQCRIINDTTTITIQSAHTDIVLESHTATYVPAGDRLYRLLSYPLRVLVSPDLVTFIRAVDNLC